MGPHLCARTAFIIADTLNVSSHRFLARAGRPVLEKPFVPAELRESLATLLPGWQSDEAAERINGPRGAALSWTAHLWLFLTCSNYPANPPECADGGKLLPTADDGQIQAIAHPLQFQGRKRVHHADSFMTRIAPERMVEHLASGFVVMKKPALDNHGTGWGRGD
jgi:hypothetical protein